MAKNLKSPPISIELLFFPKYMLLNHRIYEIASGIMFKI